MVSGKIFRLFLALLFLIILSFLYLQFENTKKSVSPGITSTKKQNQTSDMVESFTVKRVIDGDTIQIDNGKVIRYIGIDTPEAKYPRRKLQCFGKEAAQKNKELVEGKRVSLEKDVSDTDKYGRLLRYVYTDDVFVNDYLARQGYAYVSTYPPDVKYQAQFLEAQKEARENNRGLWRACATDMSQSGREN